MLYLPGSSRDAIGSVLTAGFPWLAVIGPILGMLLRLTSYRERAIALRIECVARPAANGVLSMPNKRDDSAEFKISVDITHSSHDD